MIIVYYSRGSLFPALLAALKHCRPSLEPEQAWPAAASWIRENQPPGGEPLFLKKFAEDERGDIICPAAAGVPGELLKRTLQGLGGLLGNGGGLLAACYPLCWSRRWEQGCGSGRKKACWQEIEALVERSRLQAELIRGP